MKLNLNRNKAQAKKGIFNEDVTRNNLTLLENSAIYKALMEEDNNDNSFNIERMSDIVNKDESGIKELSYIDNYSETGYIINFLYVRAKKPTQMSINTLLDSIETNSNITIPVHMPRLYLKFSIEFILGSSPDNYEHRTHLRDLKLKQVIEDESGFRENERIRFPTMENFYTRDEVGYMASCFGDNLSKINALSNPELFTNLLFTSLGNFDLSSLVADYGIGENEYYFYHSIRCRHSIVERTNENKAIIYTLYDKFKDNDDIVIKQLSNYLDIKYKDIVSVMKEGYDEGELSLFYICDKLNLGEKFREKRLKVTYDNRTVILQSLLYHLLPNSDQLVRLFDFKC